MNLGIPKLTLVLIHGFGGSSIYFYKLLPGLISNFRVILVDMIGMGGSSRPQNFYWNTFTPQ